MAIEANPANAQGIRSEAARRHSRIRVEEVAAFDANGDGTFYVETPKRGTNIGTSSVFGVEAAHARPTPVRLRRLDSYPEIAGADTLALWVDVEGAAFEVLSGLGETLGRVVLAHVEVEHDALRQGQSRIASDVERIMAAHGLHPIADIFRVASQPIGDVVYLRNGLLDDRAIAHSLPRMRFWAIRHAQRIAFRLLPMSAYIFVRAVVLRRL